ncbi:unnamed protein product, partial [Brassica rapa subsp. narinosa]
MVTGIPLSSSVAQASSNGIWSLPRGRHQIVRLLRQTLTLDPPSASNTQPDVYLSHMFFECSYSSEVWLSFFMHPLLSPPTSYTAALLWLRSCSSNPKLKVICHLLYQTTIYGIWRERNSRIHSGTPKPPHILRKDIIILLRAKLAGLDQA